MAGYSGTSLVNKIGIKPGHRLAFINAPKDFTSTLGELPDGVKVVSSGKPFDVAIVFATSATDFQKRVAAAKALMAENGMVWAAWPKKSSGMLTDLVEDKIRGIGLASGLVDIKVCAIDETWSGLKFVIRVADRKTTANKSAKKAAAK